MSKDDKEELERKLAAAYQERDRVAILAGAMGRQLGMRVGVYADPAKTERSAILQIDLPSGQVIFRLAKWQPFSPAWEIVCDYDGHDDEEKWRRIHRFVSSVDVRSPDDIVVSSFRETVANLELQLKRARSQRTDTGRMFVKARQDYQRLRICVAEFKKTLFDDMGDTAIGVRLGADGPSDASLQACIADRWKKAEKLADEAMRETGEP